MNRAHRRRGGRRGIRRGRQGLATARRASPPSHLLRNNKLAFSQCAKDHGTSKNEACVLNHPRPHVHPSQTFANSIAHSHAAESTIQCSVGLKACTIFCFCFPSSSGARAMEAQDTEYNFTWMNLVNTYVNGNCDGRYWKSLRLLEAVNPILETGRKGYPYFSSGGKRFDRKKRTQNARFATFIFILESQQQDIICFRLVNLVSLGFDVLQFRCITK